MRASGAQALSLSAAVVADIIDRLAILRLGDAGLRIYDLAGLRRYEESQKR